MKLLLGVATYKRPEKLLRLLKSLHRQTYQNFDIYICGDNNDYDSANIIQKEKCYDVMRTCYIVQDSHKFVIGAWNRIVQENIGRTDWNGFCGLVDDVELYPNALEELVKCHQENFPDTDGVCGFKQECPGHPEYTWTWYGQTLVGRKWVDRYKEVNYNICCPFYKHFYQDQETWIYANSLNKFKNCENAILLHYHPGFIKEEIDATHHVMRSGNKSPKQHDQQLWQKRQKKCKIWGQTWEK